MNIVLLVVDTLRAQNLELYGYGQETAPFLKEMGEKHLYLEKYYTNSPWTVPSHATIFTRKLPSEHGTTTESIIFRHPNLLVKQLKEMGYETIGISENALVDSTLKFDKDFDRFIEAQHKLGEVWQEVWNGEWDSRMKKWWTLVWRSIKRGDVESMKSIAQHLAEKALGISLGEDYNPIYSYKTIQKAKEQLNEEKDAFLFMNLMPAHTPYTFNEEEKEQFLDQNLSRAEVEEKTGFESIERFMNRDDVGERELEVREQGYNAAIRYTDSLIEELCQDAPEDTVFLVVGDHGEMFGENTFEGTPIIDHHFGTYKQVVHVPLIAFPDTCLELEQDRIYDHRDLHNIILELAEEGGDRERGRENTIVEYYGKAALNRSFGDRIPEKYRRLFERKSFSKIDQEWKYDHTSYREHLWKRRGISEDEDLLEENRDVAEKMRKELLKNRGGTETSEIEI